MCGGLAVWLRRLVEDCLPLEQTLHLAWYRVGIALGLPSCFDLQPLLASHSGLLGILVVHHVVQIRVERFLVLRFGQG